MRLEIIKSSFGEDDDDLNRNFIWLQLRVTHTKDSDDDEMINLLITMEGVYEDFEIGLGDGFKLKEQYYSTIDKDDFYYEYIIKLLDKLNSELDYSIWSYMDFDSKNIIGFNIEF